MRTFKGTKVPQKFKNLMKILILRSKQLKPCHVNEISLFWKHSNDIDGSFWNTRKYFDIYVLIIQMHLKEFLFQIFKKECFFKNTKSVL